MSMTMTQVILNIVMAVVGGFGGFLLGYWVRGLAAEEQQASTNTGMLRVAKMRRSRGQAFGAVVVVVVLALMVSGVLTQSGYDRRLSCNSDYINQFQETLRKNADVTKRSQEGQLANIRAQRDFLVAAGSGEPDPAEFSGYIDALNEYERSVVVLQTERVPYPTNPNCEEQ